jgi:hypothetical protein
MNQKEKEIVEEMLSMKELKPKYKIDEDKLKYNEYYKSLDFWKKKFPKSYENIPEMKLVIENIRDSYNSTPLEEMEVRISER